MPARVQDGRAAVLGSPIAHSLSPVLHTAAYAALGLDDWTYSAIECDEAGLPGLLASCDSASPGAAAIQAVLSPASGNWIYFVTVNPKTGETLFTASQAQFEQYRAELQYNLAHGQG